MAIFSKQHSDEAISDEEKAYKVNHDEYATEKSGTGVAADAPGEDVPWTATRVIAIAALCIVYVGSQMILYFASPALSAIAASFHTTFPNWLLTANTLAVAAICPFVGYVTDLVGRRWIAIFGTLCLIVGSVVMATAHSLGAGIAAMAVAGIGAGICELTALAGVAEISPQRWRGVTLSCVTFSIIPFMPSVLYVVLCERAGSWRWTFCICGIWNFIGLVGLFFCYHPPKRHNAEGLTTKEIFARIDWMGALLSIGGVTLFLVGLQAGGYQYSWTAGRTLGPLIVGLLMILAFPIWEFYGPHKYPMMPRVIFQGQRVVALAYLIVFIAGMDFYSILGFFPVVLADVYNTGAIEYGIRAMCYPWAILGGACIVSALMSYTRGHVRVLFLSMAVMMTAFTAALAATTPHNPGFTIAMATLGAFGNGAIVVPALTLALYAAPDDYIGTVAALSLSSRFVGGSVGTTIYFNIFNNKIMKKLPAAIGAVAVQYKLPQAQLVNFITALASSAPNFQQLALQVPGATQAMVAAATLARQGAFADSLKYVWYTTIPFGVISCIACLFLPNIRKYMTNRVAVDLH